ncbi:hypothetical protein D1007_23402 [Hordeum vulgare]|nr:hypothetical protein D1007_23402 [Hordeum vulgare]KAI5020570.1 hypothetical protein ZWY2020_045458 [Hordeum vulgare]
MSPPVHTSAANARVVDVWADNEEAELARISQLFRDFPIAVVATYKDLPPRPVRGAGHLLFRDGVYHVVGLPRDLNYRCYGLHTRVRDARFFQLALALLNRDGDVALGRVWRFNIGPLLAADDRFLVELGVEPPIRRRIHRDHIGQALWACQAVHNPAVTWVTCDGAEDICHLLDCFFKTNVVRVVSDRNNFVWNSRSFFPQLYDLRILAEWRTLEGEEPPLSGVREAGPAALLRAFLALMRGPAFAHHMKGYNGILSGVGHLDTPGLVSIYPNTS